MKTKSILTVIASLALAVSTVSTLATPVHSSGFTDEGTDLPIIEVTEIADFLNISTPSTYKNFYIATDGNMKDLNTIIAIGNIWGLSDYGYYSESGHVWVVFNDHNTYDCTDDEIVEVFEAPTNDSEELAIYETVINHIQTML